MSKDNQYVIRAQNGNYVCISRTGWTRRPNEAAQFNALKANFELRSLIRDGVNAVLVKKG